MIVHMSWMGWMGSKYMSGDRYGIFAGRQVAVSPPMFSLPMIVFFLLACMYVKYIRLLLTYGHICSMYESLALPSLTKIERRVDYHTNYGSIHTNSNLTNLIVRPDHC